MVFNTLTVGAAVTPTVVETWLSHYLNRKPLRQKPTAHISYHMGLQLLRQFIEHASHHTVEDIQAFTAQWVPTPRWVRVENVTVPEAHILDAVRKLQAELGPKGIEAIGGPHWWQWRPTDQPLKAEWLEMRKDYLAHKQSKEKWKRCLLYVHGGAYYFGSVDEHRYQVQRHARKLQARVLSPRYRLAPQYPFPCGLLDCLATYMYLLSVQPPETILLAGDSAGGGLIVSLLVILRNQGIPLPAGGILISPWVDLTHSFPSLAGWDEMDYVPSHGFMHRPSLAWPPANVEDLALMEKLAAKESGSKVLSRKLARTSVADPPPTVHNGDMRSSNDDSTVKDHSSNGKFDQTSDFAPNLAVKVDGQVVELKDQIQLYTTNALISHPLVSPVLQPSLGGLPPLLVLVGGGELLRDEQLYLAEKAAHPAKYPPSPAYLAAQGPHAADTVTKYPPTNVQLQVWEDMCHVAPTLSFTRPAKHMFRSIAQFGAWCLAHAQKTEIDIIDDDSISVVSNGSSTESGSSSSSSPRQRHSKQPLNLRTGTTNGQNTNSVVASTDSQSQGRAHAPPGHHPVSHTSTSTSWSSKSTNAVGTAGAPLPAFIDHMIRQRVDRHGIIYPLAAASTLPACQMSPEDIGIIKPGPVRKWLETQREYKRRFAKHHRVVQAQRVREMRQAAYRANAESELLFPAAERPPPSALARRAQLYGLAAVAVPKTWAARPKKVGRFALRIWSGWGSKHDETAVVKEEEMTRRESERDVRMARTGGVTKVQPCLDEDRREEPRQEEDDEDERSPAEEHPGRGAELLLATTADPQQRRRWSHSKPRSRSQSQSRMRARRRSVIDEGQIACEHKNKGWEEEERCGCQCGLDR